MQEILSILETPATAGVAQESRNLRPRVRDASRVTPGALLNVASPSEALQVVPNLLAATPFEPEDPSNQVSVADNQSPIIPPDRSLHNYCGLCCGWIV